MNKFIYILFVFQLLSCDSSNNNSEDRFYQVSIKSNLPIYKQVCDSFNLWVINKLGSVEAEVLYKYHIDSLLCLNNSKTRLITCRQLMVTLKEAQADDLQFVYGEKINNNWYFFKGPSVNIPRSLFKNQDLHAPLTYTQLHQAALKNIYSGYLKNGQINEAWFTSHFEHIGWGDFNHQEYDDWCFKGKRYTDISEYYQATHLCKVRSNWASRDTTQPIIPLPQKNLP